MSMNKLQKIVTSRFFISAVVILLEFAQLLAVFIILNIFSSVMVILSCVFSFCVLLYVINREEIPELKLPWLILILLLPVFGAYIFILFNGNEQTKKLKKAFDKTSEKLSPYRQQNPAIEVLQEQNTDAYLQANYLYRTADMPYRNCSKVTYYRIGEEFFAALLEALDKAEHFIFMEYFIIEQGIMWDSIHNILAQKVKQGVKVNVIYDDFGCMNKLPQHYYRELTNEGIGCIPSNRFKPVLSQIHNNRDHRKITVIDGIVGFTGGINLADEYINAYSKHGHWKDSAVKVEGEAVKNLTMLFLSAWNMQNKAMLECKPYLDVQPPAYQSGGAVIPYGDGSQSIYQDCIGRNVYLNMISAAKKYVYITTPYLICDFAIMDALRTAAKKGLDVRIITPGIPDKKLVWLMTRSNYEPLVRDGVKIYEYIPGFIHAKNFICDGMYAVCGTINLDYRSLVHHFECGVWMYNVDAIGDMTVDFIDTMAQSDIITTEKAKLTAPQKLIRNIMKIFFPLL